MLMRAQIAAISLLLAGCAGFSGPLIPPKVAWNRQLKERCAWHPCPIYVPYFHGYDETGEPRCTVRPLDFNYYDIDQLNLP